MVATNPTNPNSNYQFPYKVLAITQDAAGRVHAVAAGAGGDSRIYYLRFTLNYNAGKLSGFTLATVAPIALPDHKRVGFDTRADIKMVKDNTGAEQIVYEVNLAIEQANPYLVDIHVYMGKGLSLQPSAVADFVGLKGEPGDTLVFNSCNYAPYCASNASEFSNHVHNALFAQNEASKDLYLFEGPIDADYGVAAAAAEANKLRAIRLISSTTGWSIGNETVIATNSSNILPQLSSVVSAAGHAWVMYLHPAKGVTFGSFASDGTYNESAIPSPDNLIKRNGWGVFSVSANEAHLWAIWDTLGYYDVATLKAVQAYWNGSVWTRFNDAAGAANSMGMAGISGWQGGVCGLLFNGDIQGQTYTQPSTACIWGE